jgi:hypothetical protein
MANDDTKPDGAGTTPDTATAEAQGATSTTDTPAEPKAGPKRGGRKAETVAPKVYGADDDWPLGGSAPHDVVRVYDPSTSQLGKARKGPAKPGERAVVVAVKGDMITRSVLRNLGRA